MIHRLKGWFVEDRQPFLFNSAATSESVQRSSKRSISATISAFVLRSSPTVGGMGKLKTLVAPPLKRTWTVIRVWSLFRVTSSILQDQAGHALAVAVARSRISPEPGKVLGYGQDLSLLLLGDCPLGLLALFFVLLTGLFQLSKLIIPDCLQRIGDPPVVGIDAHITHTCLLGLVLRPFDDLATQTVGLSQGLLTLLLNV